MRMIARDSIRRWAGLRSPDTSGRSSTPPSSMGYEREHESHRTSIPSLADEVREPSPHPGQRISPVGILRTDLCLALDELAQLGRHLGQRLTRDLSRAVRPHPYRHVVLTPVRIRLRVVVPCVRAPALLSLQRSQRYRLRNGEHRTQVHRQVPARVVLPVALNARVPCTLLLCTDLLEGLL